MEYSPSGTGLHIYFLIPAGYVYNKEEYLYNEWPDDPIENENFVMDMGTSRPVAYQKTGFEIDGVAYDHVFFLKPGEKAEISFPEGAVSYRVVECGVNTDVYQQVTVNGATLAGTRGEGYAENRADFGIDYATPEERARVTYTNDVNPDALRTLTFRKRLFNEDATQELDAGADDTSFTFRLYLGTEFDANPDAVNMHTYHIKDHEGNYCYWDTANKRLQSIGAAVYESLSDEDREKVSMTTSGYGTISRVPAGYTVEVRNLLAGTKFRVQERPWEMPDGYSLQRYEYYEDFSFDEGEQNMMTRDEQDATTGVQDVIRAGQSPHVDVLNLKGWGLRVNKTWSDADYMSDCKSAYFAIYTGPDEAHLTLVNQAGTDTPIVRRMAYGEKTLYWYFLPLPVAVPLDNYWICEVQITDPVVDEDGNVTGWTDISPIGHGGSIDILGTQKGETTESPFTYTVLYDRGEITPDSNVRVDEVTNYRPGIELYKTDWDGTPLPGATFALVDAEGNAIGTFTSDESGLITVAFLRDNVQYTLTETDTPDTYRGLDSPIQLQLNEGEVVLIGAPEGWCDIASESGGTPRLTIRNPRFRLEAVKIDRDTEAPIKNVNFSLHQQHQVGAVIDFDTMPMAGYETLRTNNLGVIPKIDNTLRPGTYQLREKATPSGYEALPEYIAFTLSDTGVVTLSKEYDNAMLEAVQDPATGDIAYTLRIINDKVADITLKKVDDRGEGLKGSKFTLERFDEEAGDFAFVEGYEEIDLSDLTEKKLAKLKSGRYRLTETDVPPGYLAINRVTYFNLAFTLNGAAVRTEVTLTDETGEGENIGDPLASVDGTTITVMNRPGVALPSTGGEGTFVYTLTGALMALSALALLILRRRKKA